MINMCLYRLWSGWEGTLRSLTPISHVKVRSLCVIILRYQDKGWKCVKELLAPIYLKGILSHALNESDFQGIYCGSWCDTLIANKSPSRVPLA